MKAATKQQGNKRRAMIFIVEDHPITRHGLVQLINQEPDLTVCGEADNAKDALTRIQSKLPDLVLADITISGKSGLELLKDLTAAHARIPVLVLSMHDEELYAERVLRSGGRGYLMKSEGGAELLKAIRHVLGGEVYVSKRISAKLLNQLSGRAEPTLLGRLTDREFEIFQLLGQGLSAREIGQRLHISSKTVDTHRLSIKDKLGLKTMPQLMKYAVRWSAMQDLL
jgi:DNA-binding NarL/FixJ family response regulator